MIIVYCIDENYKHMTETSIKTVKKYNPDAFVVVVSEKWLIVDGADGYFTWPINRKCRHKDADRISDAAYLKLLLPDILPYDKVIFMDGDVECMSPLNELWDLPCKYINICESHNYGKRQAQELGVEKYGLTGMMVMNLKALRKLKLADLCLQVEQALPTPITGWFHEETCINVAMKDKLTFIDKKWNYCRDREYDEPVAPSDVCLLHYVGRRNKRDFAKYPMYDDLAELKLAIKGKDVAIVGNAQSIFDTNNGDKIDSTEFVVRFNKGFITKPDSQGTKTSMLVLACLLGEDEAAKFGARYIINRSKSYVNPYAQYTISNADRARMRDRIGKQPSSGFMIIDLCLTAGAKSITLYGFAGNKAPTFYNPEGYITQHDYDVEQKIIKDYEKAGLLRVRK